MSVPGEKWPCDVPVGVWEPEPPPPLPPSRGSFIGALISFFLRIIVRLVIDIQRSVFISLDPNTFFSLSLSLDSLVFEKLEKHALSRAAAFSSLSSTRDSDPRAHFLGLPSKQREGSIS